MDSDKDESTHKIPDGLNSLWLYPLPNWFIITVLTCSLSGYFAIGIKLGCGAVIHMVTCLLLTCTILIGASWLDRFRYRRFCHWYRTTAQKRHQ